MEPRMIPGIRISPLGVASVVSLLLAPGLASAQGSDPTLVDIALELGFQDRLTHGRGQVAADFDGDGWTDFYINNTSRADLGNDESFILFNRGPDGLGGFRFERGQTLVQGIATFGNAAADYDNDGDPDIFLAVGGQEAIGLDYLFENDGNGNFTDVSEAAGIRGPRDAGGDWVPTASLSGHWADYDRDGDSDLFVFSKVVRDSLIELPDGLGWRDSLFRNNGDGTFTDVSVEAGIVGGISTKTGAWGDYDNDGWIDIF
ncbi:MAG: VCBS repeat-containing protein, partial [Pseudomonadota bacterium]